MNQKAIDASGSMVSWDLGLCRQSQLASVFAAVNLEELAPPKRSKNEILRAAASEYKGKNTLLQALAKKDTNGLEAVNVDRGEESNQYAQSFTVCLDDSFRVVVRRGSADIGSLQALVDKHKQLVTAGDVGQALKRVVLEKLHGIPMRKRGGQYWIPAESVPFWESLGNEVEQCVESGDREIVSVKTEMTSRTARHICNSLTEYVKTEAGVIMEEIKTLQTAEAITRRVERAGELHRLVNGYSMLLANNLDSLRTLLQEASAQATFAAMAAME